MPYPKMFGKDKLDDQGGFEDYWRFFIPWFNVNEMQSEENLAQMKWLDWLSLYIFEKNLNLFQCQFFIMTLVYIYYKKCEFWILDYEVNVKISPDTEQMLERF